MDWSFAASHIHGLEFKIHSHNCRGGEVPNTQADDEMSSLVTSPRSPMRSQKSKPDFFYNVWRFLADLPITLPEIHISVSLVKCSCLICILLSGIVILYMCIALHLWAYCLITCPDANKPSFSLSIAFPPWFSESDNSCYYNIKPNCQKENICTDKQLYSNFYSSGTAHFDGILPLQIILSLIYVNSPNTLCISIYQPLVKLTKPGSFVFLLF